METEIPEMPKKQPPPPFGSEPPPHKPPPGVEIGNPTPDVQEQQEGGTGVGAPTVEPTPTE
jgi:hypothetical protein